MKITLENHISTKTYNVDTEPYSMSFISDENNYIEYVLKDKFSLLWDYIVKTRDYDLIRDFAVKNNLDNILDDFLYQLKDKNIIKTDLEFKPRNTENFLYSIKMGCKNYRFFNKAKDKFLEKNFFIETLNLILTYECNLSCKHCCSVKGNIELTFEQAKEVIDKFYDLGINKVILTGGECTLNKDLLKIAKYVKSRYLKLIIKTNGQKFYDDEDLLNEIIKIHPYCIDFSLYSADPEIHDNMTGVKGSYNKTLSVIKKINENNILVKIANFISKYNKDSDAGLIKLAKELNVSYAHNCSFINNPDNNNLDASLSEEEMAEFYFSLIDPNQEYKQFKKSDDFLCKGGITRIAIAPNLDILPCPYNKHIFGNFNTTTIKELKEKILPQYRKIFTSNNLTECFKYDYCKYCPYCTLISCLNEGFMKKSEILCANARAMQKAFLKYEQLKKA